MPLKTLLLVGPPGSRKRELAWALDDLPTRKWLARSRSTGQDEGYYADHVDIVRFESEANCFQLHHTLHDGATYSIFELGREMPDGIVLLCPAMQQLDEDTLDLLRLVRRAGVTRLALFLDWPEALMTDPAFEALAAADAARACVTLAKIGFAADTAFTAGDAKKAAGCTGAAPEQGVPAFTSAFLKQLDALFPERPEEQPVLVQVTGQRTIREKKAKQPPTNALLCAKLQIASGVLRQGRVLLLTRFRQAPARATPRALYVCEYGKDIPAEVLYPAFAYCDSFYADLYFKEGAAPQQFPFWLGDGQIPLYCCTQLNAVVTNLVVGASRKGGQKLAEGELPPRVVVQVEGHLAEGTISLANGESRIPGNDYRAVSIQLDAPVFLPHKARVSLWRYRTESGGHGLIAQGMVLDMDEIFAE